MAYQNVGIPKFFVDHSLFYQALDVDFLIFTDGEVGEGDIRKLLQLNPSGGIDYNGWFMFQIKQHMPIDYIAFLGHTGEIMYGIWATNYFSSSGGVYINYPTHGEPTEYNGFTFLEITKEEDEEYIAVFIEQVYDSEGNYPDTTTRMGAVSLGSAYTMPHSPELSLTMSREMDGVKRVRTRGGADLIKHQYTKPSMWGDLAPWELDTGHGIDQRLARSGRRVWDLSFNYLSDSDIFPLLSSVMPYGSTDYTADPDEVYSEGSTWHSDNTIIDDNTFYNQVIHRTNGGQLPFIFQPDSSNNNLDNFAICKFDMSSFQFKQVANGVYNMKLKIREVW